MQKRKMKRVKEHFEANMLDGKPVEDCGGAMLSAISVWEYIQEYLILPRREAE